MATKFEAVVGKAQDGKFYGQVTPINDGESGPPVCLGPFENADDAEATVKDFLGVIDNILTGLDVLTGECDCPQCRGAISKEEMH